MTRYGGKGSVQSGLAWAKMQPARHATAIAATIIDRTVRMIVSDRNTTSQSKPESGEESGVFSVIYISPTLKRGYHQMVIPPLRRTVPQRILIADDSQSVRTCIRRMIEGHEGWEICGEAKDGHEAMQKTFELSPDVVVLDFFMPETNGIVVAREIAEKCPKTAVILCSMYLD